MTVIYYADGAKILPEGEMNEYKRTDLKVFCPGCTYGEEAKSPLNPMIC